jgi:hypothetical protein
MKNVVKSTKKSQKISEGATTSKMRRIVTGQSAGDEIHKLPVEQQKKLIELYLKNPTEAAEYLRSIIIKEKNSQFGLGLALTLAGAGMIYKAANMEPPPPPEPTDAVMIKANTMTGGINDALKQMGVSDSELLSKASTGADMKAAIIKLGGGDYEKGVENLLHGMDPADKAANIATLKATIGDPSNADAKLLDLFPPKGYDNGVPYYGVKGSPETPGWWKGSLIRVPVE